MSRKRRSAGAVGGAVQAAVFAALGDKTRLALMAKLCRLRSCSISELTEGSRLTRQAITKHLRVLERAGIVHGGRKGREIRFELDPAPIMEIQEYLERVSEQWDQALSRLKLFVEK